MQRKNIVLLIFSIATVFNADAQSTFLILPASSYLDNVSQTFQEKLIQDEKTTEENRFWTERKVSLTYSFEHTDGRHGLDAMTDFHAVAPELYLESASGFSLNIGGAYARSSLNGPFGFTIDGESYGASVQPAYDLFALWNPSERPDCMRQSKLIAGAGFGYVRGEAEYDGVFGGTPPSSYETETDLFAFSPSLIWVQPLSENFVTFLIPAYSLSSSETRYKKFPGRSDQRFELFTLTARADYRVCEKFSVAAFATWLREIDSKPSQSLEDSAEFGAQFRVAMSDRVAFRVGYSYEAFHRYFEEHNCFARLEAGF